MSDSEEESSSPGSSEWPVTEEWLEAVLKQHHSEIHDPQIAVIEFTVRPGCDVGESVLSDILAVNVEYRLTSHPSSQDTHFLSFIIKLLPQDPFSRFFVTEAQFDLREIKFYTQVVPDLESFQKEHLVSGAIPISLPIPRCYHAHYSAGSNEPESSPQPPESVLVLENIKPAGYSGADFSRGLTLRQTRAAMAAIARIHALSLCLKVKEGRALSERYPFLFQTSKATDSYQQLVERGLPQLSSFLERRPGLESILQSLNSIRSNTKELIAALLAPEEPLALITHTDFWCNNLMFRESANGKGDTGADDETCCAILDWQMVTYSRPTNDLALLLVSSVPSELRRLHTPALLDGYWTALTECCQRLGVDVERDHGYTRERLADDYRRSQLLALLLCIGSIDVALGDPLTEQRLLDVLHDLDKEGVLCADLLVSATATTDVSDAV